MSGPNAQQDWKQEMLWLTVLYRIMECGDRIPLDTEGSKYSFIDRDLTAMHQKDLIEISKDNTHWVVTKKGEGVRDKMVAIFDQCLKFEIFGEVSLAKELSDDETEDGMHVFDHMYDPRFAPVKSDAEAEALGTEDFRLAMITYLGDTMRDSDQGKDFGQPLDVDPHRVVFMQQLSDGKFKDDNIWFDLKLGTPFKEIEEIVSTSYRYQDVSDNADEIDNVMQNIYTAGMLEQRKRDGFECKGCHIPLGVFEMNAKENGGELTECPNPDCGQSLKPPPEQVQQFQQQHQQDLWECPNCGSEVYGNQHSCRGCGARIDFSMPEGSVHTETTTVYESYPMYGYDYGWGGYDYYYDYGYGYDCWGGYYGYEPYGYYSPYDPFVDMVAFGAVCAVLW